MSNNTEVVFENIEQRILKEIEEAHYAIFVSVAWFTNKRLFKALLEKAKANCYVSIIIQLDDINLQSGIDYEQIKIGRSECFTISKDTELLHDKFCVIDFRKVITGSYNWTYKASHNSENVIVLNDPFVATQYITRFEQQKAKFNIETNQVSEIKVQATERDKTNVNKEERTISESVKIEKKAPSIAIEEKRPIRKCNKCNREISEKDLFCTYCGKQQKKEEIIRFVTCKDCFYELKEPYIDASRTNVCIKCGSRNLIFNLIKE